MHTETARIANAEAWQLGGGVDAAPTNLSPSTGPVWVSWHAANYAQPFVEWFETAGHAADEMWRRTSDRYYPLWDDVEALVYGVDPDDYLRATGRDAYPLAEMHLRDDDYNGYTVTLNDA